MHAAARPPGGAPPWPVHDPCMALASPLHHPCITLTSPLHHPCMALTEVLLRLAQATDLTRTLTRNPNLDLNAGAAAPRAGSASPDGGHGHGADGQLLGRARDADRAAPPAVLLLTRCACSPQSPYTDQASAARRSYRRDPIAPALSTTSEEGNISHAQHSTCSTLYYCCSTY